MRKFGDFTAVDHVSFEVRARRDLRPARPQRRRQDDDLPHALRPAAGQRRHAAASPASTCARARASARAAHRLRRAEVLALRPAHRSPRTSSSSPAPTVCAARASASASTGRCEQFELEPLSTLPSGQLPGGYKQRLAMAAALLHEPEILFLDEPTSGADPLARREFWRRITALAEQGVTVIVTTHFMEEAEYCDRIAILDAGRVLARARRPRSARRAQREPGAEPTWKMPSSPSSTQAREHGQQPRRGEAPHEPSASRHAGSVWRRVWRAGAQGDAADRARSEQHRDRRRAAGDPDPAVRLRRCRST